MYGRTHLCLPYNISCVVSLWNSFCNLCNSKQANRTERDLKDASKGQVNINHDPAMEDDHEPLHE